MVASQGLEDRFGLRLQLLTTIRHLHQRFVSYLRGVAETVEHFLKSETKYLQESAYYKQEKSTMITKTCCSTL